MEWDDGKMNKLAVEKKLEFWSLWWHFHHLQISLDKRKNRPFLCLSVLWWTKILQVTNMVNFYWCKSMITSFSCFNHITAPSPEISVFEHFFLPSDAKDNYFLNVLRKKCNNHSLVLQCWLFKSSHFPPHILTLFHFTNYSMVQ